MANITRRRPFLHSTDEKHAGANGSTTSAANSKMPRFRRKMVLGGCFFASLVLYLGSLTTTRNGKSNHNLLTASDRADSELLKTCEEIDKLSVTKKKRYTKHFDLAAMRKELPPSSLRSEKCAKKLSADSTINDAICRHRFIWLTGLHFSGTSLLNYVMQTHDRVSGHIDSGAPQDEGQWLQNEFKQATGLGGICGIMHNNDAFMDERHALVNEKTRACVFANWAKYWDLSQPVLLEKSPTTILQLGFREALFPGVSASVVTVRHPLYACLMRQYKSVTHTAAMGMFNAQRIEKVVTGWLRSHRYLQSTLPNLDRYSVLMFEDFFAHKDAVSNVKNLVSSFYPDVAPPEPHTGRRRLVFRRGSASRREPEIDPTLLFSWAEVWNSCSRKYPRYFDRVVSTLEKFEGEVNAFGYSLLNVTALNTKQFEQAFGSKFNPI